jgi:integrase/recombinase XerD
MGKLDPDRVRFTGPLASLAPGLREELARLGYARTSAATLLQLAAHLSRWLDASGLGAGDLTGPVIERFLVERRRKYRNYRSVAGLAPILGYLRGLGVVPEPVPVVAHSPAEVLLDRFATYLTGQRALTGPVAVAYCHWVRPFTQVVLLPDDVDRVEVVTAADVNRFLAARLPAMSRKSAQMTTSSVRSLLRFLHAQGRITSSLAEVVPAVASWRLSGLPRALPADQVQALLDACDPSSAVGRRDVAVITMLRRLGLRCAEVAALELTDIDWSAGTLTIHGKGSRTDRLPLPVDVGEAVVEYLRAGRPSTEARTVFVRAVAPFTPLKPVSVTCIVARAARRAGLGTVHAHRLRHTAASETLNAGASLQEVAQLLRHSSVATTVIYAKTDRNRLAQIARPWPGAGGPR